MPFEHLVARLAGGFSLAVDGETLRGALQEVLPQTNVGELETLKLLPGMVGAAADTLHKAWRAGIDLSQRGLDHPRIAALANLEAAVLQRLPQSMRRPQDLVALAQSRMVHAPALFGEVEIVGISELSPCWRPLLLALAEKVPVRWHAGPRLAPSWLNNSAVQIVRSPPENPSICVVSASTGYHEAVEAFRWARRLIASGQAKPHDIAIAATAPAAYDDEFLALRRDTNIDLHFVHGVRVVSTREGQAAAALADILVHGLSQTRLKRLATLLGRDAGPFRGLPDGWQRVLPPEAPLSSRESWERLFRRLTPADWPDGIDHSPRLKGLIETLFAGTAKAAEVGSAVLSSGALQIWQTAMLTGNATAIDLTIDALRQVDTCEACVSVAWMPASALAASPRPFVRLLGLTSTAWPRRISEDRLLADHIVPAGELDPLPVTLADRRDFQTILRTTRTEVVLSRARRDGEGRMLGKSPLLRGIGSEIYLRRNQRPAHAMSETDRLFARPDEFAAGSQAASARACWHNWHSRELTGHDGIVRPQHPTLFAALSRVQSASSLSKLLRGPLAFSWHYGLGLRAPRGGDEALVLDANALGTLVHDTLDQAIRTLERLGGLASASSEMAAGAVDAAVSTVAERWEAEQAVPPRVIWQRSLGEIRNIAWSALQHSDATYPGQISFTEVPFGGQLPRSDGPLPWDASLPVEIAGTDFKISGYIDRLDLSGNKNQARVRDYKTGRMPSEPVSLNGGRELQRCLYAYAVRAMLGDHVEVEASLLYPREAEARLLEEPDAVLQALSEHLAAAWANLLSGVATVGPDAGGDYDDFSFALPANAANGYCKRKAEASRQALGDAALVWEAN